MEPDKLEKYIQAKLQEREIQPSENAWQRISEGLQSPEAKKRKVRGWYGIAASILALIGFSLFYFRNVPLTEPQIDAVVNTKSNGRVQENDNVDFVAEKEMEVVVRDTAPETNILQTTDIKDLSGLASVPPNLSANKQKEFQIHGRQDNESTREPILALVSQEVLTEKISEVIAQVQELERNNGVSEAEIDSLLYAAQKTIITEKLFTENNKVNAMALLSEVEEELDQSFRDHIFESLKVGFLKVRTAVADRNN
jgi:hypothetical protein